MSEVLLPCPFCGGPGHRSAGGGDGCRACSIFVDPDLWNRRAAPPLPALTPEERWVCEGCGQEFDADQQGGHCRVEPDELGEPMPVQCGPVTLLGLALTSEERAALEQVLGYLPWAKKEITDDEEWAHVEKSAAVLRALLGRGRSGG